MTIDWTNYRIKLTYGDRSATGLIGTFIAVLVVLPAATWFCWNEIAVGRQWYTVSYFECVYGTVVMSVIGAALFGRKSEAAIVLERKETK